jgi:hypothetical protein
MCCMQACQAITANAHSNFHPASLSQLVTCSVQAAVPSWPRLANPTHQPTSNKPPPLVRAPLTSMLTTCCSAMLTNPATPTYPSHTSPPPTAPPPHLHA